jgi:hypothetical protein
MPSHGRRARCASSCRMRRALRPTRWRAWSRSAWPSACTSPSWWRTAPAPAAASAWAAAAKMPADGYTLVIGHVGTLTINPSVYSKLQYDPDKDFVPIIQAVKTPLLLVVAGVVAAEIGGRRDRRRASRIPTSSPTPRPATARRRTWPASTSRRSAGAAMTHVPFKNASDALVGVASGEVSAHLRRPAGSLAAGARQAAAAAGLTSESAPAEFPRHADVVAETAKGYEMLDWCGFMAPRERRMRSSPVCSRRSRPCSPSRKLFRRCATRA